MSEKRKARRSPTTQTTEKTIDGGQVSTTTTTNGNGNNRKTEEKKFPKMVDIEKPKSIEINEPKTKETRKSKKQKIEEETKNANVKMMSEFLQSVSAVVSSRNGFEHWALTDAETENICKPLYNIFQKSESAKKVLEKSDEIALATACMATLLPRAFITVKAMETKKKAKKPAEKIEKKEVKNNDSETRETERIGETSYEENAPFNDGYGVPFLCEI